MVSTSMDAHLRTTSTNRGLLKSAAMAGPLAHFVLHLASDLGSPLSGGSTSPGDINQHGDEAEEEVD
jgi:hypothetical protein